MGIKNSIKDTLNIWSRCSQNEHFERLNVDNFNIHIPETTGSALSEYLTQKYSAYIENMIVFHGPQIFLPKRSKKIKTSFNKNKGRKYSYGVGHVPFSIAKEFFELGSIFAVVRHPIDRWLSTFFKSGNLGNKEDVSPKDIEKRVYEINLTRAREEQLSIDVIDNVTVRMLCDDYLFPSSEIDYKNFESAFRNLEMVQIINTYDLDDVFYDSKKVEFEDDKVSKTSINKHNPYAELISDELLELAATMNAYDMQLWNLIQNNNLCLSDQQMLLFNTQEKAYIRSIDHSDFDGNFKREEYEIYPDGRPDS